MIFFKNLVKFVYGFIVFKLKIDNNNSINFYTKISKKYHILEQIDRYVNKYQELNKELEYMLSYIKSNVKKYYPDYSSNILDYGCGSGRYLKKLDKYNIYGIDANSYVLDNITQKKHSKC
jgi:2-polyprenyl-3-methyl-5-hydroxy-6-metoxy-1,4-benzoquinol methylase